MNGPSERNFMDRLRQNATLNRLTRGHPDLALIAVPIAIVAIGAILVGSAFASGGDDDEEVRAETPTPIVIATPTPGQNAGLVTPIAFSEGDYLTSEDLASRGVGEPGRGEFTGERLVIAKIGVDAPFTVKTVPGSGQMPNPNGPEDVAYYDFSSWPTLGGLPDAGGNIVLAGHVDYINYGPAVFWRLTELVPGDIVEVRMQDGSVAQYRIEFNKTIEVGGPEVDWSSVVQATADESITLITCTGEFEAGHYNNRQIVWGRRV
jgi:LPXTG-site transpeptidase (sortase) family protein